MPVRLISQIYLKGRRGYELEGGPGTPENTVIDARRLRMHWRPATVSLRLSQVGHPVIVRCLDARALGIICLV